MATVLALPRSLSIITTDLATTQQRLATLQAATIGRDPDAEEDALWSSLEQRIGWLRAEADAAFLAATGVAWSQYERVRA